MSKEINCYNQKYSSLGIMQKTYIPDEDETDLNNNDEASDPPEENENSPGDSENFSDDSGTEEKWDLFRPESTFDKVFNSKFIRNSTTKYLERKKYLYPKSDYYFLSYINNNSMNQIIESEFKIDVNLLLTSQDIHFFRLFGFSLVPPVNEEKKISDYLKYISIPNGNFDKEKSKQLWPKYNNIEYKEIKLEECKQSENNTFENWILGFHDYGVRNNISFIIFISYGNDSKINQFNVGANYPRNRCFATFLKAKPDSKEYQPYILSLISKTFKDPQKESKFKNPKFDSVSDQYFIIKDTKISNEDKKAFFNYDYNSFESLYFNIKLAKNSKEVCFNFTGKKIQIASVFKLNLLLKNDPGLYTSNQEEIKYLSNFNKHFKLKGNSNQFKYEKVVKVDYNTNSEDCEGIFNILFRSLKNIPLKKAPINEYQVFVGLKQVAYPSNVASHFSIFSSLELKALYVDEVMEKVYAAFVGDNYLKLVEGEIGTQKMDDMIILLTIDDYNSQDQDTEFYVDCFNNLYFKCSDKVYKPIKNNWDIDNAPQPKLVFKDENVKTEELVNEQIFTRPCAIEINDKLFLLNETMRLYHPAWRNTSLRHGIISTFYRLAFHVLPDDLVFVNDDVHGGILYPQVDIGFRGNINTIFTSANLPGIFEYSDNAFNFNPLKSLLPYVKTNFVFFNNGNLKVGLDRHRTRCQLAATALFGFACTIYGPGMRLRDFRFEASNPFSKEKFSLSHNFLIAAYGTLLKMKNDDEFNFAIDTICQELNIVESKQTYIKLIDELKEGYY